MIPIIKSEFKSRRTSLIAYCLVVVGLLWMYIALFPSIQAQSASLSKVLESFGSAMKAFGIKDIGFDTLEKFLSIELFGTTWPILAITFATSRAGHAIAGETEKHTIGTLLALPISRANLYFAKYFAGLLALTVFVGITAFAALPIAAAYGISFHASNFISLAVLCWLFSGALFSLAMLFSSLLNEKGHVYLSIGGLLLLMYVANIVAGINSHLQWLRFGSLFYYFNASEVLVSNSINLVSYAVFGCIIVVATLAGMAWFRRKDVII